METEETTQVLSKREKREIAKAEKEEARSRAKTVTRAKKIFLSLAIFGGLAFSGYKLVAFINTPTPVDNEILAPTDADWVRGNREAKVTLVEYADFECPACAAYEPLMERLVQDFPNDLRVIFRHFPLVSIHKNSMAAAQAVEAAGKQDKFWEMARVLFERQEEWVDLADPKDKFTVYAKELGSSEEQFLSDYNSQAVKDKINADILTSQKLRLTYTPSFLLEGELVSPKSYEEFKKLVEDQARGYSLQ